MAALFLLLFAASLALAVVLTQTMHWLSPRLGLVDHPGERKIHAAVTPSGGGVAIFLALWLPVWAAVAACALAHGGRLTLPIWPELLEHAPGVMQQLRPLGVVFIGAVVIWLLGLADDRWGLSPWFRLAVHLSVGVLFVVSGMVVTLFIEARTISYVITVLWIAGLINSFNMLDNMDGLSSGVGCIISLMFTIVAIQTGQYFIAAFLCCLAGSLAGFLVFNFPPASIFMGDSGGTLIGYLLAAMTVQFTFYHRELADQSATLYFPIVVPLLMFALPLFDTITVVWIRLRSGRSPFHGDTNHFSHRLVGLGMSRRQAVLLIYLITAAVALGATVLFYANSAAILVIFAQAVAVFTIIGILEHARPKTAENEEPPR